MGFNFPRASVREQIVLQERVRLIRDPAPQRLREHSKIPRILPSRILIGSPKTQPVRRTMKKGTGVKQPYIKLNQDEMMMECRWMAKEDLNIWMYVN